SAFLSWLTVRVIAATGTMLRGRDTGRWAAWLAAVSPFLIHHGQEARMYGLVAAVAAINLMLLSRFATGAVHSLGWAFAVAAAALIASHYYGVFFVAGELLVLVMLWRRPLQTWLPTALATVAVIL